MLSYRHGFHAGNHADVLKHMTEVLVLDHLNLKADKKYAYIDTHAGPGLYDLAHDFAQQTAEFETGIAKLWSASGLPQPVARYLEVIKGINPTGALTHYPGSPAIARALMRPGLRLNLFELHPADFEALQTWAGQARAIQAQNLDGFARLPAIVPPPERRALVMIDPPFEVKRDYQTAVDVLERAVKRFATGIYALWYPLLDRTEMRDMAARLDALPWRTLHASLSVRGPASGGGKGSGMWGSAMFVVNPPWKLAEQLQDALPHLVQALGQDGHATYRLDAHGLD